MPRELRSCTPVGCVAANRLLATSSTRVPDRAVGVTDVSRSRRCRSTNWRTTGEREERRRDVKACEPKPHAITIAVLHAWGRGRKESQQAD